MSHIFVSSHSFSHVLKHHISTSLPSFLKASIQGGKKTIREIAHNDDDDDDDAFDSTLIQVEENQNNDLNDYNPALDKNPMLVMWMMAWMNLMMILVVGNLMILPSRGMLVKVE